MPYVWTDRGFNEVAPRGMQAVATGYERAIQMTGARKAAARVTFAANLAAGETVVVNGVTFTARASGATTNEFNIGGSLSLTLDAMVTAMNASVSAGVSNITTSKFGTTGLNFFTKVVGTAGNYYTLASTAPTGTPTVTAWSGGTLGDAQSRMDENKTVSMVTPVATLTNDTLFTLKDGEEGQEKTLHLQTKGANSNAVVTGTFAAAATTATFDTLDEFVKLKWLGSAWRVLTNSGVTIA